jgi:arginine transport system permease protein
MIPIIVEYLPQLAHGILITVLLMIGALALGIVLALLMTLALISNRIYFVAPVQALVFFIRGTPLLVQIFLIYFGSGQFDWLKASFLWPLLREPFVCAVIALALNTAAYSTVLFKGAVDSVPENEVSGCHALGMSKFLMLRRIILPRAFRIALPAYSNEVIIVLKSTSLASTITILDLMGVTNKIIAQTYLTIEFLAIVGVIYLLLNSLIVTLFKYIERKANVYL